MLNSQVKKRIGQKSCAPTISELITFLRKKPHLLKNEKNNYSAEK